MSACTGVVDFLPYVYHQYPEYLCHQGKKRNLEAVCREAMKQIEEKQYVRTLEEDGMTEIIRYGITCY